MRLDLNEIADAIGADSSADLTGCTVTGVATDSRECRPGCIFVCIRGERVDGHDYAGQAVKNGAVAVLAERDLPDLPVPVLKVANTVQALGGMASLWRQKTRARVICITGTAGKTTLKELLADILSRAGKTARSEKNHNNQIGLPCSMLAASGDEDFWVMEAGISHEGDMDELASIVRPDLAIILNASEGHTEGLGEKGVAWHKARILHYLADNGLALVSAEYPDLLEQARVFGSRVRYFGTDADAQYLLTNAGMDGKNFQFLLAGQTCSVSSNTPLVPETALAAASAAHLLGVDIDIIEKSFASINMPEHRNNIAVLGKWTIIDDTYNANPLSMARMLQAAKNLAREKALPLIAVLGEMGELGARAEFRHEELGRILRNLKVEKVFWKGHWQDALRHGLGQEYASRLTAVDRPEDFEPWALDLCRKDNTFKDGGVIIFKGSRLNRMEDFLAVFNRVATKSAEQENVL